MKAIQLTAVALLLTASAACTGSPGNAGTASENDVARYQALAAEVQSAAADYRSRMMTQATMDAGSCESVMSQYYDQAWPWVFEMHQRADALDDTMRAHGGGDADYACVSESMSEEFEHHHAVACTFADLSANQAEVQRHVTAMGSYASHLEDRCDQMMAALDGSTPDWGPMMASCQVEEEDDACDTMQGGMMHGSMMGDDCD